ncbi:MAG: pyridoxamine 5'-phosphate oxidase family protein [bacterium]|nr:pyridoxamine 5'-phosphate oxidase family protein [bacterium]MDE0600200.1 pyridoxamine 5'-phosphate oxidase family protein [bacterium]
MSEDPAPEEAAPPSDRVRVRRFAARARYERSEVLAILDGGLIAHVGVSTRDGPVVLPMAYGRDDEHLYLHGAVGNHLLRTGDGQEICVTVTHLDGLVMARTPFHNSMNYRSVVVRGSARRIVDGDRKLRALRIITDHVVPNWDNTRLPSASDLRSTLVLELSLAEASAKVRVGDPVDEPEDLAGPWWAGVVPISTRFGPAVPSSDLTGNPEPPASIQALSGITPDDRVIGRDA